MSKIAEQKALEAYPDPQILPGFDSNKHYREGYITGYDQGVADEREKLMAEMSDIDIYHQGYDQAMQDFLEKTEEFLYLQLNSGLIECGNIERLIEQFKNYMQDEM